MFQASSHRSGGSLDQSRRALGCPDPMAPFSKEKLPEDPFVFKPYQKTLFSKFKRMLGSDDSNNLPRYPLGGSFVRNTNTDASTEGFDDLFLSQSYRFNKHTLYYSFGSDQGEVIRIGGLDDMAAKEDEFIAVAALHVFGCQYLVITVYNHASASSRVLLHEVVSRKTTALPISEAGYATQMTASLLDESAAGSHPRGSLSATFLLVFGLAKPEISAHVVSVGFSLGGEIHFEGSSPFKHTLSPAIKLACVKSWVARGSRSVFVGFGTTGGSFHLLKILLHSDRPPAFTESMAVPLSGLHGQSSAASLAPVTWLDMKSLDGSELLLMAGQGSVVYDAASNPSRPSFSLIQLQQDFSRASLVFSYQPTEDTPGAFTGASLTKVGSERRLAFAYWQGSAAPLVKTHHLGMPEAGSRFDQRHEESILLKAGDIPLDFQSCHLTFRLLSLHDTQELSLSSALVPNPRALDGPGFFLEKAQQASADRSKSLVLADMPFLRQFLVANPPRTLVVPPTDEAAAKEIAAFVSSHVASAGYEDVVFCYCLAHFCEDGAHEYAQRFLSPETLDLVVGYSLIDRQSIAAGVNHIVASNSRAHFPRALLDLVLGSGNLKQAAQLWLHLKLHQQAPLVMDPKALIRGLFSFGMTAVHQFLEIYHDGAISREEAFRAFYLDALADKSVLAFTQYTRSHPLSAEEEGFLRSFLKSDVPPRGVLANGLHFFTFYLFDSHRLAGALDFFHKSEKTIQTVCSPDQYTALTRVVASAAEKCKVALLARSSESALLDQKAQFIAKTYTQRPPSTLPSLPLFSLLCQQGLTPESAGACLQHSISLVNSRRAHAPSRSSQETSDLPSEAPSPDSMQNQALSLGRRSPSTSPSLEDFDGSEVVGEIEAESMENPTASGDNSQSFNILPGHGNDPKPAIHGELTSQGSQPSNSMPSTPEPCTPHRSILGVVSQSESSRESTHSTTTQGPPNANDGIIDVRRESNVSLPSQALSPNHSTFGCLPGQPTQEPQDTSTNLQPISQLWPPLGERFPESEQSSQERFPNFLAPEIKASSRVKTRSESSVSGDDKEERNGYNTRSKSRRGKRS